MNQNEEQENRFWERVAKATTPGRSLARWKASRDAVHERVHPHRPGSRLKWVFIAAPAFAAAALFFYKPQTPPPRVAAPVRAPEAILVAEAEETAEMEAKEEAEEEEWNVRATAVTGDILLTSKDGVPTLLDTGAPLEEGDALDVPADGSLEIAFAVDSVMQFGPGSRLTIGSLQRKDSVFELAYGSLVAKLNWAKRRGYALRIRSPTAVAAVRGTEFAMEVAENGDTDIGVFDEGKIAVSDRARPNQAETMLTPNQETRIAPLEKRSAVRALKRLAHHREGVRHMNRRQAKLREHWKNMSPTLRRARRKKMRERLDANPKLKERLQKRIKELKKQTRSNGAKRQRQGKDKREQGQQPKRQPQDKGKLQQGQQPKRLPQDKRPGLRQQQQERPRPQQRLQELRQRRQELQQRQRPKQRLQKQRQKQQRQRPRQGNKRPGGQKRRRDGGRRPRR